MCELMTVTLVLLKDWAVDEHYVYLARELCDYSLAEYVSAAEEMDATIPTKQVIGIEILAALGALHVCGLVHGNLKPQNVLLAPSGRVVLVDAGKWYTDQVSSLITLVPYVLGGFFFFFSSSC